MISSKVRTRQPPKSSEPKILSYHFSGIRRSAADTRLTFILISTFFDGVKQFIIGAALQAGNSAIVVATVPHRNSLLAKLDLLSSLKNQFPPISLADATEILEAQKCKTAT
jgi:hypothetical protein